MSSLCQKELNVLQIQTHIQAHTHSLSHTFCIFSAGLHGGLISLHSQKPFVVLELVGKGKAKQQEIPLKSLVFGF